MPNLSKNAKITKPSQRFIRMPRGRPPKPGTAEEKAAARRERVRLNVKALRERRKQSVISEQSASASPVSTHTEKTSSDTESEGKESHPTSRQSSESPSVDEEIIRFHDDGSKLDVVPPARSDIPLQLNNIPQYSIALLSSFRGHFLPDVVYLPKLRLEHDVASKASDNFIWTPCAFWVTNAFEIASKQPQSSLNHVLMALGMAIDGQQRKDESMKATAVQMYRKGLRGIFFSLDQVMNNKEAVSGKDHTALYLTCHAAAIYELVRNPSLLATLQHLKGVAQLMSHLETDRDFLTWSIPTLLLQDYRMVEMGIALKYRYEPKFSPKKGFARLPGSGGYDNSTHKAKFLHLSSSSMMSALTDAADEICSVLVQIDRVKPLVTSVDMQPQLNGLLDTLEAILESFDLWMIRLQARCGPIPFPHYTKGKVSDDIANVFSFEVGSAWTYAFIVKAYGIEATIELNTLMYQNQDICCASSVSEPHRNTIHQRGEVPIQEQSNEIVWTSEFNSPEILRLRAKLRAVSIQLTHSVFYFLQTDKGFIGQGISIFPLDTANVMLNKEISRLQTDFVELKMVDQPRKSTLKQEILNDIHELNEALLMCQEMQLRAEKYGSPTIYEA